MCLSVCLVGFGCWTFSHFFSYEIIGYPTPTRANLLLIYSLRKRLSTSQYVQYVSGSATVLSVEFCVTAVGTGYSGELLILKVQKPRHT